MLTGYFVSNTAFCSQGNRLAGVLPGWLEAFAGCLEYLPCCLEFLPGWLEFLLVWLESHSSQFGLYISHLLEALVGLGRHPSNSAGSLHLTRCI